MQTHKVQEALEALGVPQSIEELKNRPIVSGGSSPLVTTSNFVKKTGDTMTGNLVMDGASVQNVESVTFNTNATVAHQEGQLHWDNDDKTLEIDTEVTGTHIQIGQEIVLRATNKTGATISNGQLVYINGAQGLRPTIALADASTQATSDATIGMATHTIQNNRTGYITVFGLVREVNTGAYNEGDVLYLSETAGAYTNVPPVQPAHRVVIGYVVHSSVTEGQILIEVKNGEHLTQLHDVLIANPIHNQVLIYDSSIGLWKNSTKKQIVAIKSADYTLGVNDEVVVFTATATATLPAATGSGQTYRIVCRAGVLTIDGNGSDTIKGELSQTLISQEDIIITDTMSGVWE